MIWLDIIFFFAIKVSGLRFDPINFFLQMRLAQVLTISFKLNIMFIFYPVKVLLMDFPFDVEDFCQKCSLMLIGKNFNLSVELGWNFSRRF